MLRLPSIFSISVLLCSGLAQAAPIDESDIVGSWQIGLVGDARNLPIGLAFRTGITAAVLTFNSDKTLRIEMPCRDESFIREHGELLLTGTWDLKDGSELVQVLEYRGDKKTETSSVSFESGTLVQVVGNSKKIKLGRFAGDVNAICKYE